MEQNGKPTLNELGIDLEAQDWRRSSSGGDAVEVAFVDAGGQRWALLRTGDALVSVFSRHEWECFVDGARKGEFDDAL